MSTDSKISFYNSAKDVSPSREITVAGLLSLLDQLAEDDSNREGLNK